MHPADMVLLARSRWPHLAIHCPSAHEATERLADDIAARLRQAVAARGEALLCVSGGKSPVALFEALQVRVLPWSELTVSLVDERCVPSDHPDSNARLVMQHLLQGAAAQARFVPLISPMAVSQGASSRASARAADLEAAAAAANAAVAALPVPDVLVLGMGADGHTASWFPHSPDLARALDRGSDECVCAVRLPDPPPHPNHPRLTMTLSQVLRARCIVLPVQGADKLATLARAAFDAGPPGLDALPIAHVLNQTTAPVALWLPC